MNNTPFAARDLVAEESRWRALQRPVAGSSDDKTPRWRMRLVGLTLIVGSLTVFTATRWILEGSNNTTWFCKLLQLFLQLFFSCRYLWDILMSFSPTIAVSFSLLRHLVLIVSEHPQIQFGAVGSRTTRYWLPSLYQWQWLPLMLRGWASNSFRTIKTPNFAKIKHVVVS